MKSKTILITGANSGIGLAASRQFAREGHTVVMACRNLERSKHVYEELVRTTGNKNVQLRQLDTSSQESIRSFCEALKQDFDKLDVLINNAAYFKHGASYTTNDDGIEITFATNVVGPFLLTRQLSDLLAKSTDPRVLNVSSNIIKHFFSPKKTIDFENLAQRSNIAPKHSIYVNYRNSKMALLLLTFKMADVYKEKQIKFFSLQVNGARMQKETLKQFAIPWRLIAYVQNLFFPPATFQANNYFEIGTSQRFENLSGVHINHKLMVMQTAPEKAKLSHIMGASHYPVCADNEELRERVWELCEQLVKQ